MPAGDDVDDAAREAISQSRATISEATETNEVMRKNVLLSRVVIRDVRQSVAEALRTIGEADALITRQR
jgi:hypothetical protein